MSDPQPTHQIVAGVDGSSCSLDALEWAIRQAQLTGARVLVVTAWQRPAAVGWGLPLAPRPVHPRTPIRCLKRSWNPSARDTRQSISRRRRCRVTRHQRWWRRHGARTSWLWVAMAAERLPECCSVPSVGIVCLMPTVLYSSCEAHCDGTPVGQGLSDRQHEFEPDGAGTHRPERMPWEPVASPPRMA